jgi:ribonuclease HI
MSGPEVVVYTDGACKPNPGSGGWAAILCWGQREKVLTGGAPETTSNRMELQAAIAALEALTRPCRVELHTDSAYLQRGVTEWLQGWLERGWRLSNRKPVQNADLWKRLHELIQQHDVQWHWVPGHSGDPLNERVDWLAYRSIKAPGSSKS